MSNNSTRRPIKRINATHVDSQAMLIRLDRLVTLAEADTDRMVASAKEIPRIRLSKNRVFTASFSYTAPSITGTSLAPTTGSMVFALSLVPGITSWLQCFECYRIREAYVDFNPFGIVAAANATLGQITTVIDYDDAAVADQATLLQYDTAMVVPSTQYFERRLRPRSAKAMYSGTFTSYGQDESSWIDSDSPGVQYYGLKFSQSATSTAQTTYTPLVTLIVNFRNNN